MPQRKRTTTKRPATRRVKATPIYRKRFASKLQIADMKPPVATVKFEGQKRFVFSHDAISGANRKSVLRIPANFMGIEGVEAGQIAADDNVNMIDSTTNFYNKYNHYHVLGSWIKVTAKPKGADADGQFHNFLALTRVDQGNRYAGAVSNHELETDYAVKTAFCGGDNTGAYKDARLTLSYNPKQQFGVKDTMDANQLRCQTVFNSGPNDQTFYNVILAGLLDTDLDTHSSMIVDVKVGYIVKMSEPRIENDPTILMN